MPSIICQLVSLNSSSGSWFEDGADGHTNRASGPPIPHRQAADMKQAYYGGSMPDLNDWTTPRLLSTAARLVEHTWNEELAVLRLTHAGVIALEVLDAEGSMVQARLSAKVRVQAQTMGQTLSRLEAHGHITRERSRLDGRSKRVAVSGLGGLLAPDRRPTTRLHAAVASLPWQPPGSRRRRPVPIAPPTGRRVRPR